jgi:hypothetical protein
VDSFGVLHLLEAVRILGLKINDALLSGIHFRNARCGAKNVEIGNHPVLSAPTSWYCYWMTVNRRDAYCLTASCACDRGSAFDPHYFRPTDEEFGLGDASKAQDLLGWRPFNRESPIRGETFVTPISNGPVTTSQTEFAAEGCLMRFVYVARAVASYALRFTADAEIRVWIWAATIRRDATLPEVFRINSAALSKMRQAERLIEKILPGQARLKQEIEDLVRLLENVDFSKSRILTQRESPSSFLMTVATAITVLRSRPILLRYANVEKRACLEIMTGTRIAANRLTKAAPIPSHLVEELEKYLLASTVQSTCERHESVARAKFHQQAASDCGDQTDRSPSQAVIRNILEYVDPLVDLCAMFDADIVASKNANNARQLDLGKFSGPF